MSNLYLISWVLGDFWDISKNMIKTILESDILFVEELNVFDFFIKENNIPFKWKVFEIWINNSKYKKLVLESTLKWLNIWIFESSGIPCFVDPWLDILQFVYDLKNKWLDIKIIYIPWWSAVTAALSLSWFNIDKFSFLYFLSEDSQWEVLSSSIPVIYFVEHNSFNKFISHLSFMKGISDKKVFCWFNIAKKMDFWDITIRDTFDKAYFKIEKTYEEFLKRWEVPDIVIVFNN